MNKKITIGLGIILLTLILIGGWWLMPEEKEEEEEIVTPEEEKIETKLEMGVGYSIKKDEGEAVQEAYEKMMSELQEAPRFAILSSSVGYDQEKVLDKVNEILPETKIYGYTSLMGIMTNSGFHIGKDVEEGSVLSLTGFDTDSMVFGVGSCSLDEAGSPKKAGEVAIKKAMEKAGKTEQEKPEVVLMSTSPFGIGEFEVIEGVESVLGKEVPIAGGGAAAGYSDLSSGGEVLFSTEGVYEKGVVVVPIYTDLKIGHAFLSGFNPGGHKGKVTEAHKDNPFRIAEINNRPAAKVYNEWLDGLFNEYVGTSKMFLGEAVNHTLGKKIIEEGGFTNWRMIVPFHFNPDHSITVGAPVEEGSEIHLLESNPDLFKRRAALAVRMAKARGKISDEEIAGAVLDQCGGTLLGIPGGVSGWDKMVSKVNQASGGAPFVGISNLGPYGHFRGVGNYYGEVTASVLIFSKTE